MSDNLNQLADVLYGRAPLPAEYIGGSEARIFYDAALELTTLREKLAAAEQQIEGKQAVIEASKAAINGQVKDCLKVEDDYADFRAAVAAALAELRAYLQSQEGSGNSHKAAYSYGLKVAVIALDATIAKLGLSEPPVLTITQPGSDIQILPECKPASCTWTPDGDGNYATGCDGLFVALKDSLAGYQMASCCFCGKPIKEQSK